MKIIKKFILVIIVFSFVVVGSSMYTYGEETSSQVTPGNLWKNLDEVNKIAFITGFRVGVDVVIDKDYYPESYSSFSPLSTMIRNIAYILSNAKVKKDIASKVVDEINKAFIRSNEATVKSFGFERIALQQLKEGVDAFYEDFANKAIQTPDAIYIVRMQIRGENPELIDAQIRYLRTMPSGSVDRGLQEVKKISKYIKGDKASSDSSYYWYMGDKKKTLKAIKEGLVSKENFLKAGCYCDEQGKITPLFCYGTYK